MDNYNSKAEKEFIEKCVQAISEKDYSHHYVLYLENGTHYWYKTKELDSKLRQPLVVVSPRLIKELYQKADFIPGEMKKAKEWATSALIRIINNEYETARKLHEESKNKES